MISGDEIFGWRSNKPQYVHANEKISLQVNKLTSSTSFFPMDYYQFPFCRPESGIISEPQTFGDSLAGDRIHNSPYELVVGKDEYCKVLCATNFGDSAAEAMTHAIEKRYRHNWLVDGLPAAYSDLSDTYVGFPIGSMQRNDRRDNGPFVYNHVNIRIVLQKEEDEDEDNAKYLVTQFTVEPISLNHSFTVDDGDRGNLRYSIKNTVETCTRGYNGTEHTSKEMIRQVKFQDPHGPVLFTYDVIWVEDDNLTWESRWKSYSNIDNRYFVEDGFVPSLIYMSILSLFVFAALASIGVRNFPQGFARCNKNSVVEGCADVNPNDYKPTFSWTLLRNDVFRSPKSSPALLSVCCGSGVHLVLTTLTVFLGVATVGFPSASVRGSLETVSLLVYALSGGVGGYVTARLYRTFHGRKWHIARTLLAFGLPAVPFSIFVLLQCVSILHKSTLVVPFSTLFILVLLWWGVLSPLTFVGMHLGYQHGPMQLLSYSSSNPSLAPRPIPTQPWFVGAFLQAAFCGLLPFVGMMMTFVFLLTCAWEAEQDVRDFDFGYFVIILLLTFLVSGAQSVLCCYFQLCSEDYRWWWRSFVVSGAVGIYGWLFSAVHASYQFFDYEFTPGVASMFVFYGHMFCVSLALFLMFGCVGTFSFLYFAKWLYGRHREVGSSSSTR